MLHRRQVVLHRRLCRLGIPSHSWVGYQDQEQLIGDWQLKKIMLHPHLVTNSSLFIGSLLSLVFNVKDVCWTFFDQD